MTTEGLQLALWPVHPPPYEDELLSSWLIRLAHGNGFKVQTFSQGYFNQDKQFWTRDLDRSASLDLIALLERRTGVAAEEIEKLTLRSYVGLVFEQINVNSNVNWLMQLGIRSRSFKRPGLMFCSACFREDAEPYLRRHWRMAWSAVCCRHQCILEERCGRCSTLLQPHRADRWYRTRLLSGTTVATCAECGFDLRRISVRKQATDAQVDRQVMFERVSKTGYAALPGYPDLHSLAFFAGLRAIAQLLDYEKCNLTSTKQPRRGSIEQLPVEWRNDSLNRAWGCLQQWPNGFIERCSRLKKPYTIIKASKSVHPWWLQSVCDEYLRRVAPKITPDEVKMIRKFVEQKTGGFSLANARKFTGRDLSGHWSATFAPIRLGDVRRLFATLDTLADTALGSIRRDFYRDKVMLITARVLHLSQTALTALNAANFTEESGPKRYVMPVLNEFLSTKIELKPWLNWYLQDIRSQYSDCAESPWLFMQGRSERMSDSLVGGRFSQLVDVAKLKAEIPTYRHWVVSEWVE